MRRPFPCDTRRLDRPAEQIVLGFLEVGFGYHAVGLELVQPFEAADLVVIDHRVSFMCVETAPAGTAEQAAIGSLCYARPSPAREMLGGIPSPIALLARTK